jgi:hypothetical protein
MSGTAQLDETAPQLFPSAATGNSSVSAIVVRVGEQESGLGEDVAPEFALVNLIDAAESRLAVVEPDGGGGGLPDSSLVWPFDLDERREAGPGVEVESDLSPAPLLAVILLVADLGQAKPRPMRWPWSCSWPTWARSVNSLVRRVSRMVQPAAK